MRKLIFILPLAILLGFKLIDSSKINTKENNKFQVEINDSTKITIIQAINIETKLPVYYYSNLDVPACNTGECKIINITMYWDIYGNFYKYSVPKLNQLTKADHKPFKKNDYAKLHLIIADTTSTLKRLTINDLTEKQAYNKFKTDGNSGASIKLTGENKIKGAIKTTHTLWHIANGNAHNQIARETNKYFAKHNELPNMFTNNPKSSTGIIKVLVDFERFNLTQTQYVIKNIEDFNIELKPINSSINNSLKDKNIDKTILFANYFLRNKHKSKKAIKIIKSINYFE